MVGTDMNGTNFGALAVGHFHRQEQTSLHVDVGCAATRVSMSAIVYYRTVLPRNVPELTSSESRLTGVGNHPTVRLSNRLLFIAVIRRPEIEFKAVGCRVTVQLLYTP